MIEYFIKKRKITLIFFVAVALYGIVIVFQLPKQEDPDLVISQAVVTTAYPGATPETVEQTVTKKIEQKIKEIQGVDTISSTSMEGVSTIMVKLENGVDPKEKWAELRTKVKEAEADLPADATQPFVNDNLMKKSISAYAVTADDFGKLKELSELMDSWKDQLRAVPGVADITIQGIPEQEIRIDLDTQKMKLFNVSWPQVIQAIKAENERMPIGDIDYKGRNYQLRITDTRSIEGLNKVIITRTQEDFPVYLEHIAKTSLTHSDTTYNGYYNGKPAITLTISGETGSDVPTVHRAVVETMENLEKSLPEECKLALFYALNDEIDDIFADLAQELIIAMVSVVIVCMLGLNIVTSSIIALAIPLSLAVGLLFLPLFDVTLNQVTVVGIIIVLSLLVDDAIVVNDNIERRLSVLKENPLAAAVNGTKEVIISITTATLATISAFLPMLLLPGDMGELLKPIPIVITVSLLASLVMSFTIIPIFREWNEKRDKHKREKSGKPAGLLGKQIHAINRFYSRRIMTKVVRRPLLVASIGILTGTFAYGLVPFVSVQLFPELEEPEITVNVKMPTGSSLQETGRIVKEVAAWAKKQPGVKEVSSASGGDAPRIFGGEGAGSGSEIGQILIVGKEGKFEIEQTIKDWDAFFKEEYPGISIVALTSSAGIDVGASISIRLTGQDIEQLRKLAANVKNIIAETNGTYDITDSMGTERYSLEFLVNKEAMDQNIVSYTDLSTTLRLISQGLDVSEFDTGNDLIDIKLYLENTDEDPTVLFQRLSITNAKGQQIPLAQLAEIKPTFSLQKIEHYNLERSITVEADVRNGMTASAAMAEISPKLEKLNFPDGYNWEAGGETEQLAESFGDLGVLFIACIIIIIILIMVQFYSLSIPIIILTTVYLAIAGGVIGMFITRTPIGLFSVIGLTALAGIVVRNGIVLIEFMEEARHEGMELKDAVIKATEARFRPILLTATAAIFGLLPISIIGDILFRPMAITIISGVIFSTALTLLVVPSLYIVVAECKEKHTQKKLDKQSRRDNEMSM